MSCRVIGRTLEDALLVVVADQAREHGCNRLRGTYSPTAKNGLVADLCERLGFTAVSLPAGDGTTIWELTIDELGRSRSHIRMDTTELTAQRIA